MPPRVTLALLVSPSPPVLCYYLSLIQAVICTSCCLADCDWEERGVTVKEGEVTAFDTAKMKVQICNKKGKLKFLKEKSKKVPKPLVLACNGEMGEKLGKCQVLQ